MTSMCCDAKMSAEGSKKGTQYWVCDNCKRPCSFLTSWTATNAPIEPPKLSWVRKLLDKLFF